MTNPAFVPEPTVEVGKASKWFGQKVAVSDLSCSFGPGLSGLLGPNGAGKTTLLRMIAGLIAPSDGEIAVEGRDPRASPDVYRQVGLVPEEDATYSFLTARQYVAYSARLSGVEGPDRVADSALQQVELSDVADRHLGGYSKGMRQRAKVAAALVHQPQILILDEPLNGTDPVQRARLIEVFKRLAAEGRTLIVSSHVLAEVERMAERVVAIVDGRLAAAGDIHAIRAAMSDIPFRVRIEADPARGLAAALLGHESVRGAMIVDSTIHIEAADVGELGRIVPSLARDMGVRISAFQPEDESLESVFRYLVRRHR